MYADVRCLDVFVDGYKRKKKSRSLEYSIATLLAVVDCPGAGMSARLYVIVRIFHIMKKGEEPYNLQIQYRNTKSITPSFAWHACRLVSFISCSPCKDPRWCGYECDMQTSLVEGICHR